MHTNKIVKENESNEAQIKLIWRNNIKANT